MRESVGEEKQRKERPDFLFVSSGFLGNDWAVRVLSCNLPNETRGPRQAHNVYFSPFFIFTPFPVVTLKKRKIIQTICISFARQPTVSFPHFSLPRCLPEPPSLHTTHFFFFLSYTFSKVLRGQRRDLWLAKQQMRIFYRKS